MLVGVQEGLVLAVEVIAHLRGEPKEALSDIRDSLLGHVLEDVSEALVFIGRDGLDVDFLFKKAGEL